MRCCLNQIISKKMVFLYILQKGGRFALWGQVVHPPKSYQNYFWPKMYSHRLIIIVFYYFNPIPQIKCWQTRYRIYNCNTCYFSWNNGPFHPKLNITIVYRRGATSHSICTFYENKIHAYTVWDIDIFCIRLRS